MECMCGWPLNQSEHILHEHAGEGSPPLLILVNLLEGKAFMPLAGANGAAPELLSCPTPEPTPRCDANDSALTRRTERQE